MLTRLEYPTFLSTYVKHGRSLFLTTPPKKKIRTYLLTYLLISTYLKLHRPPPKNICVPYFMLLDISSPP